MRLSGLLGATALAGAFAMLPGVVAAQTAATPPAAPTEEAAGTQAAVPAAQDPATQGPVAQGPVAQGDEITVTGSRIRSPNATSVVPVTTISAAD